MEPSGSVQAYNGIALPLQFSKLTNSIKLTVFSSSEAKLKHLKSFIIQERKYGLYHVCKPF
jgi:hypothetical protein